MSQQQFHAEVMAELEQIQDFEREFQAGKYDGDYAEYIIQHSAGDRVICNGDTLIQAIKDGYLYEQFRDSIIYKE